MVKGYLEIFHKEIEPRMGNPLVGGVVIFSALNAIEFLTLRILPNLGVPSSTRISDYLSVHLIVLLVSNILLAWVLWFYAYIHIPKFALDEIGILIALTKRDEKADPELKQLSQQLEEVIAAENLVSAIRVQILPDRLKPKNEKSAVALRDKFRAELIIWGHVDYGKKDAVPQTMFSPVNFTYRLQLPPAQAQHIAAGITHVLANKTWSIREENNLIDRQFLAYNTKEVSLYIIGTVLFFRKRYEESIEIVRKTLTNYKAKQVQSTNDLVAMGNLRVLLSITYLRLATNIDLKPNSVQRGNNITKMRDLAEKMRADGFKEGALAQEAQIEFAERGVTTKSKELLKEAQTLNPSSPANCFSLAFLYFYEGDLKNGHLWLRNALDRRSNSSMKDQIPGIIGWYEEAFREDTSKTYLEFPLGILSWVFLDNKEDASKSLTKFLSEYGKSTDISLRPIIFDALWYLKRIRKDKKNHVGH